MERYKDNIDEFFRMSLESFDREPSERVWENVDSRLSADVTIWTSILSFFTKYIWFFVIGSTFVAYHFYAQNNFKKLTQKVSLMDEKYGNLESEYLDIDKKYSELKNQNAQTEKYILELEKSYSDQNNKLLSFQQNIARLKSESDLISEINRKANYLTDLYNSKPFGFGQGNPDFTKQANTNRFSDQEGLTPDLFMNTSNNSFNDKVGDRAGDGVFGANLKKGINREGQIADDILDRNRTVSFASIREGWNWSKWGSANTETYQRILRRGLQFSSFEGNELEIRAFKYRYGANVSTINVITNSADKRNFGISTGFVHELGLTKKWSLTNSINYILSNYEIDNGSDQLSASDLEGIPGGSYFQDPVKVVEVNNQYFDFNIGVNRRFNIGEKGSSLFVNPSVGWQFFFPQEYLYTFVDGNKSIYDENRFIGYFGTAKVQVGYEKPLSEDMRFLLGIYGERSLIKQGQEKRNRVNVGISSTLLFGK